MSQLLYPKRHNIINFHPPQRISSAFRYSLQNVKVLKTTEIFYCGQTEVLEDEKKVKQKKSLILALCSNQKSHDSGLANRTLWYTVQDFVCVGFVSVNNFVLEPVAQKSAKISLRSSDLTCKTR